MYRSCHNRGRARVFALTLTALTALGCQDQPEDQPPPPLPYNHNTPTADMSEAEPDLPNTNAHANSSQQVPTGALLGEACEVIADCSTGLVCDMRLGASGYCRPSYCGPACERVGGVCAQVDTASAECWAPCDPSTEQREGFSCEPLAETYLLVPPTRFSPRAYDDIRNQLAFDCSPRPDEDAPIPGPEFGSGPTYTFTFNVAEATSSFLLVPFASTGTLYPIELTLPDGKLVDLVEDYRHHNARIGEVEYSLMEGLGTFGTIAFDWPILIPYAPQHQDMVMGGEYKLRVLARDSMPCLYVRPSTGEKKLSLNIYSATPRNYNAWNMPLDRDFQEVIAQVGVLFAQAGVELDQVTYANLPPELAQENAIIRSLEQGWELGSWGYAQGDALDNNLTVDLFLVQDIMIEGGLILGLSGGVPGPAGLHGNLRNGLVFGISGIGVDNKNVGHVIAHELGHYLGLRHTTELLHGSQSAQEDQFELFVGVTDPLEDTQECPSPLTQGFNCPDARNMMFPAIPPASSTDPPTITQDQARVLRASPLTR